MLVRIPRRVHFNRDFHARIEGGGRFRGFVLAGVDGRVQVGGAPYVSNVQPGWCSAKGCDAPTSTAGSFPWNIGRYLPAGTYRLYQVADGDMKLTLRIDSLKGSLHARPSRPVQSDIRMLRASAAAPTSTVYAAGEFTPLSDGVADFAAMGLWADGSPHAITGYGECFYEPQGLYGQILPRDLAFAPNCPTGENLWTDGYPQYHVSNQEDVTETAVRFSISYSGAAISGVGGWFDSAAEVHDFGVAGLWLNFQGKNALPNKN
jgi:hypothetical protein